MSFAVVFREQPLTRGQVSGAHKHDNRNLKYAEQHSHIDQSRMDLNEILHGTGNLHADLAAVMGDIPMARAGKTRADEQIAGRFILTAHHNYFREMLGLPHTSEKEEKENGSAWMRQLPGNPRFEEWKTATMSWLWEKYGDNLASAVLHMDEGAPHVHAYQVPIVEKSRINPVTKLPLPAKKAINYNELFGDKKAVLAKARAEGRSHLDTKLGRLQTEYATAMASCGLVRGKESVRTKTPDIKHVAPHIYRAIADELSELETRKADAKKECDLKIAEKDALVQAISDLYDEKTQAENECELKIAEKDTLVQTVSNLNNEKTEAENAKNIVLKQKNELQQKVDKLNTDFPELEKRNENFVNVNNREAQINDELKAENKELKEKNANLSTDISNLKTTVSNLRNEETNLNKILPEKRKENATLDKELPGKRQEKTNLDAIIPELRQTKTQLDTEIESSKKLRDNAASEQKRILDEIETKAKEKNDRLDTEYKQRVDVLTRQMRPDADKAIADYKTAEKSKVDTDIEKYKKSEKDRIDKEASDYSERKTKYTKSEIEKIEAELDTKRESANAEITEIEKSKATKISDLNRLTQDIKNAEHAKATLIGNRRTLEQKQPLTNWNVAYDTFKSIIEHKNPYNWDLENETHMAIFLTATFEPEKVDAILDSAPEDSGVEYVRNELPTVRAAYKVSAAQQPAVDDSYVEYTEEAETVMDASGQMRQVTVTKPKLRRR